MAEKSLPGKDGVLSADRIDAAVERGLSARTQKLIDRSESESTRDNRTRYWSLFEAEFCRNYGVAAGGGTTPDGLRYRGLRSLPASPDTLAEYVGFLAHRGYAPSTIQLCLATVRWKHRVQGEPVPDGVKASAALRGYKDELLAQGWRPRRSAPARTRELERLVDACPLDTVAGLRDRSMILLGYAVAARRRALVNLDLVDLWELDARTYRVSIYRDKGRSQRNVAVSHWGQPRKGWCRDPLCPLCATFAWVEVLHEHKIEHGPLYRPIDKGGNIGGVRPLAGGHDERLGMTAVNYIVDQRRIEAGLPKGITPHSLRAGFATESYEQGADPLAIKRHGGWTDDSTAFNVYIREVDDVALNPLQNVVAARRRARTAA